MAYHSRALSRWCVRLRRGCGLETLRRKGNEMRGKRSYDTKLHFKKSSEKRGIFAQRTEGCADMAGADIVGMGIAVRVSRSDAWVKFEWVV